MGVNSMQTLRDLRKQCNLKQQEVAKKLNVTRNAYSNYEQGIRKISLEQVLVLSKLFDVSAEEIIEAQLNSCQCDQ